MIVVRGPETPAEDQAVLALHQPLRGCLVVATPPAASPARLFSELLTGLGKSRYHAPRSLATHRYAADATVWLRAYEIRHLVILHADAVARETWSALAPLEATLGLRVWLLTDERRLGRTRLDVGRAPLEEAALGALGEAIGAPSGAAGADGQGADSASHAANWPTEFERLRADSTNIDAYRVGFVAATAVPLARRGSSAELAEALRDAVEPMIDRLCLLSAARAARAALLEYGWRVGLDVERLAGRPHEPTPRERMRRLDPARIATFADPLATAALTLAALELSEREMLRVRRADVAADCATVRVGRDRVAIPEVARPFLRAQQVAGGDLGAGPDDPLLGTRASIGIRDLRSLILSLYDELDIGLTAGELRDRPSRDERWLAERGITLARTDGGRRPARLAGVYDPVEEMRAFRASLVEDWRAGRVGLEPCACPAAHVPPAPRDLPAWPVDRRQPRNADDHPWHRPAAWTAATRRR